VFVGLYWLGGVRRPAAPALELWMGGQEPAWDSPPLLATVRGGAARLIPGRVPARAWTRPASVARPAASLIARRDGQRGRGTRPGPVLFAYDGTEAAKAAIAEAGRQLPARRDALVLTVWRTFSVGFLPEPDVQFDAACGEEVGQAAEQTAFHGARLAEVAGFRAQPVAAEGTPAWQAILDAADDHDASLIVLGSHRRGGLGGLVAGSIASDVASRSDRPVLIIHAHAAADATQPEMAAVGGPADAESGDH
jgi:nucleotide-binding universal stress UspA family protein